MPDRLTRKVAPPDVDASRIPDPWTDDDGEPLSVEDAAETLLKLTYTNYHADEHTSRLENARHYQYPRLLENDRKYIEEFDLTTGLMVRKVSPFDEQGEWLTPHEIFDQLCGGGTRRSVREALSYHLDDFDFEWVSVVAPRETDGTPYEMTLLWIDDSADEVDVRHLEPALERHIDRVPGATEAAHQYSQNGTAGVLQVRNDPPLCDSIPEKYTQIFAESNYSPSPPTKAAQHLASRLPDLQLADHINPDMPDVRAPVIEGVAATRVVRYSMVRFSDGTDDLQT